MTKLYAFLLALLFTFQAYAQTEFSSFQVPLQYPSRILTAVNSADEVCFLAFEENGLYSSILSPEGERTASSHLVYTHNERTGALGLIALEDKFIYFERATYSGVIQPFVINKETGFIHAAAPFSLNLDKGDDLVQAYTLGNKLYTLHFNKKEQKLQVHEFSNETEVKVTDFLVQIPKMHDRLLKGEAPVNPVFIDKADEQTLGTSSRQKKIYHEGDNIYIIIDAFGAQRMNISNLTTEILHLNLATKEWQFRSLPLVEKIRPIGMNSFMHDGMVFRFLVTPGYDMQLAAYDLETLQLKKEYNYNSKDPLTIKSTPVSSSRKSRKEDTTTVERTETALKKLKAGNTTIFVEDASQNVLQLTLGNHAFTSGAAGYIPSGTSLLTHVGPAALPVVIAIAAIKADAKNSVESTNSFSVYLDREAFETVNPVERKTYLEQVAQYNNLLSEQKVKIGATFAYTYQDKMHYGFLDKDSKSIKIVAFSK